MPVITILVIGICLFCSTTTCAQAEADPDPRPPRWSGVTVVDVSGWEFRNVELVWVGEGQALQITRSDGAAKTFAPTDLQSVLDAAGADITAAVVSQRFAAGQPPFAATAPVEAPQSPSGYNEIGATAQIKPQTISELIAPRLFTFAFDAGAGYGGPVGDWYRGMDAGMLFAVGARIRTGANAYVHLVFRTRGLGTISAYDYGIDAPISVKSRVSEYLFMVGGHARLVEGRAVRSTGYMEAGGGLLRNTYDIDYLGSSSGSVNKVGFAAQGGILLLLSDQVALDLCGSLNYKPGFFSNSESMGLLLGLQVGLMYYR
jgi:hypothetical protein